MKTARSLGVQGNAPSLVERSGVAKRYTLGMSGDTGCPTGAPMPRVFDGACRSGGPERAVTCPSAWSWCCVTAAPPSVGPGLACVGSRTGDAFGVGARHDPSTAEVAARRDRLPAGHPRRSAGSRRRTGRASGWAAAGTGRGTTRDGLVAGRPADGFLCGSSSVDTGIEGMPVGTSGRHAARRKGQCGEDEPDG